MKSLVRQQFLDQTWDAALDAAAKFWLQLYAIAADHYGYAEPLGTTSKSICLVSRHLVDAFHTELERGTEREGFPEPVVKLAVDPFVLSDDTLVLSSGRLAPPQAPPAGLGLPLLSGPGFEGLAVELRFRITGRSRFLGERTYFTMAIAGEVRDGMLLVKAVWRSHYTWNQDDAYRFTPMPQELEWVGASTLPQGRRGNPARLGGAVRAADFRREHPVEEGSAPQHPVRSAAVPRPSRPLRSIHRNDSGLHLVHRSRREGQTVEHSRGPINALRPGTPVPVRLHRVEVATHILVEAIGGGEAVRNARALPYPLPGGVGSHNERPGSPEIHGRSARGRFPFLGDVVLQSAPDLNFGYRTFGASDGVTYLVVIYNRRWSWPAFVSLQAQTFFQGGGRVDSYAGANSRFERSATGPGILLCDFPPTTDPIQFYRAHSAATEVFVAE